MGEVWCGPVPGSNGSMPRPLHCVNRSWACACGPCLAAAAERWMLAPQRLPSESSGSRKSDFVRSTNLNNEDTSPYAFSKTRTKSVFYPSAFQIPQADVGNLRLESDRNSENTWVNACDVMGPYSSMLRRRLRNCPPCPYSSIAGVKYIVTTLNPNLRLSWAPALAVIFW